MMTDNLLINSFWFNLTARQTNVMSEPIYPADWCYAASAFAVLFCVFGVSGEKIKCGKVEAKN
jgi:hypothetical protein